MAMIAAGIRQVHKDADKNNTVKFDQGIYKVPEKAQIEKREGAEWVWCEAYADADAKDGNYALIGGQRVPLAVDPDMPDDE